MNTGFYKSLKTKGNCCRSHFFTIRSLCSKAILLFCFIIPLPAFSQTYIEIGSPSGTTQNGPSNSTASGDRIERHTAIYRSTELTAAGVTAGDQFSGIGWSKQGAAGYTGNGITFRVWLKPLSANSFTTSTIAWDDQINGATLVYEHTSVSIPAATGWLDFNFSQAIFTWNGTDNVQVITELIRPGDWTTGATAFDWAVRGTATNTAANASDRTDAPPARLTRSHPRPLIRFKIPETGADGALTAMPRPLTGVPGNQDITVSLQNAGAATLTSAEITYSINASGPVTYSWTGSLTTSQATDVVIGNVNFTAGNHTIDVKITSVNGGTDTDTTNNRVTKSIQVCHPLSGSYSINSGLPTGGRNYASFADFSNDLTQCGISGNVIAAVEPGSGPYLEQVVFEKISGSGPAASVTIEGNGAVITSAGPILISDPNINIIQLNGVSYFNMRNLTINVVSGSNAFIAVHAVDSGRHISITGCNVDMGTSVTGLMGAFVFNASEKDFTHPGGTFEDIRISKNSTSGGDYGVSVTGVNGSFPATGIVVDSNVFANCVGGGVRFHETDGAVVSNNQIDKGILTSQQSRGIYYGGLNNTNGIIFNNRIRISVSGLSTMDFSGICLAAGLGHKVYNNVIHDVNPVLGRMTGILLESANMRSEVYNNTIAMNHTAATSGTLYGIRAAVHNTRAVLRNNIISITQPATGFKAGILLASAARPDTSVRSDYNVIWVPGGHTAAWLDGTTPVSLAANLASWQAAGQDTHSLEADPVFESVALPRPTKRKVDDAGIAYGALSTDILGTPRGTPPDIGAYEFTACPQLDTPSVHITADRNSPVCEGTQVTFTATPVNGGANPSYQWKKGSVNTGTNSPVYTYNATTGTDTIHVVITNHEECALHPDTASNIITLNILPIAVPDVHITAYPQERVCEGSAVTLVAGHTGGGPAPSFRWFKDMVQTGSNSDTFRYIPAAGDRVYVILTGSADCTAPEADTSDTLTLQLYPLPAKPVVTRTGDRTLSTDRYAAYQWYRDGEVLTGAEGQTYDADTNGAYTVTITDSNGCQATSDPVMIQLVVAGFSTGDIRIFPNPAAEKIYIDSPEPVAVLLSAMDGRVMRSRSVTAGLQYLDVHHFPAGVYLIRITDPQGVVLRTERMIIGRKN